MPLLPLLTTLVAGVAVSHAIPDPTLAPMPPALETRLALSALPAALRPDATVYLLDPAKGYHLSRGGASGITCIVQRTAWELRDFRDDIFIPLCYDAEGTKTYLKSIMDAAELRAGGMGAAELYAEMDRRWASGTYNVPGPGVSYMLAPLQRTVGPPDLRVVTISLPHLMFYAPHVTNQEIGARPDLADPATLRYPFIDRQGPAAHSYMIQLVGESEKARILADEASMLRDLCAWRDVLCLARTPATAPPPPAASHPPRSGPPAGAAGSPPRAPAARAP